MTAPIDPSYVAAWPTIAQAAAMLNQDESELAADHTDGLVDTHPATDGTQRVRPAVVLALAVSYAMPANEVAALLVDHAKQAGNAAYVRVVDEVDAWLERQITLRDAAAT